MLPDVYSQHAANMLKRTQTIRTARKITCLQVLPGQQFIHLEAMTLQDQILEIVNSQIQ